MNESDDEDENDFLLRCGDGDDQANTNFDSYLPHNIPSELRFSSSHNSRYSASEDEEIESGDDSSIDDFFQNNEIAFPMQEHEQEKPGVLIHANRYKSNQKGYKDRDNDVQGRRYSGDITTKVEYEEEEWSGEKKGIFIDEVEGETVRRLVHSVHDKSVQLRALELQLNHTYLQLEALTTREQQMRAERDGLQYTVAEAEQDILLLEAKLRDVVLFEEGGSGRDRGGISLLQNIRDKLLNVANERISDLATLLRSNQLQFEDVLANKDLALVQSNSEASAFKEEVRHLSDQLAHRTVLYSAQDRRWKDSMRRHLSLQTEQSEDLLTTRARLQQLERTYEHTDREKLEAILSSRQLSAQVELLSGMLAEERDRVSVLDGELIEASASSVALQATVDRLRGADMEQLERDMAAEVEDIRYVRLKSVCNTSV
jgi:hypothetical protein